jgi:hypothetical protein
MFRAVTAPALINKRAAFRFRLRSLFILVVAFAVASALFRSIVRGDSTSFLGIGAFCYGGIVAIPCYAFVASLMVLTTESIRGQRAGELFAAVVSAAAWIGFVAVALNQWPQLCLLYSPAIIAIIGWLVRLSWKTIDGPSPEETLRRLKQAKEDCSQALLLQRRRRSADLP